MIILNVTTHSSDDDIVEVETYDAKDLEEKRNNNQLESIAIGDNVYSRIDLKNIKRIREELEQLNEN